ncbi:MAG: hypothetical protein JWO56_2696 [Acidobacteria bacterium]|nr:hypothetical protein [Acidobacteriota bacterium]
MTIRGSDGRSDGSPNSKLHLTDQLDDSRRRTLALEDRNNGHREITPEERLRLHELLSALGERPMLTARAQMTVYAWTSGYDLRQAR